MRIILKTIRQTKLKIIENQALNKRNYGSLQGLNKDETVVKYGLKQVEIWHRIFAIRPPIGESLEDTYNRTISFYKIEIEPKLKSNNTILIVVMAIVCVLWLCI